MLVISFVLPELIMDAETLQSLVELQVYHELIIVQQFSAHEWQVFTEMAEAGA